MLKRDLKSKSKNVAPDEGPCFFKVIHPSLPSDHLRIPPKFRKHIREDLPHRGRLRVPSEGIWSVRVVKEGNEIYLKDGWSEFVQYNSLGNNEFLMFTYRGNLSFKVEIFDQNAIKRLRRSDPGTTQPPQVQRNDQDRPLQQCQNAAKAFTSELPFFERCIKSYNVQKISMLNIPKRFARKYFPAERSELVLRNQKGKAWKVTYVPYDTNWSFYRGWRVFVRDNKLKEDDICIFELVGQKELKVYIYTDHDDHPAMILISSRKHCFT